MQPEVEVTQGDTVPCRGCLPDCANRQRCQGKPWRLLPQDAVPQEASGDSD